MLSFSRTFRRISNSQGNRIVIPRSTLHTSTSKSDVGRSGRSSTLEDRFSSPSSSIADLIGGAAGDELRSRIELHRYRTAVDTDNETVWRDSKSHLRKQKRAIENFGGVEGAVREHLAPSTTSFRSDLAQRPLDKKILEEIYRGLHGMRVERKLKRGVTWEHWIAKGDGSAPIHTTSANAKQTFAYGGKLTNTARARHERQFPSSALPEVAFIGRTSSGKSSLINAIVNAFVCPYGHLQGTTSTCDFYNVASKLTLVDLPGYGYYNPIQTSAIDAGNAVRMMHLYLERGDPNHPQHRPIKRVFVCVSARGLQRSDIEHMELLERHKVPFSVVLTKTDRAPIKFLARLTDYTRCQLVHYKYCHELMLSSALRLAGIDKLQTLIGSVALKEPTTGKEQVMDFDKIV